MVSVVARELFLNNGRQGAASLLKEDRRALVGYEDGSSGFTVRMVPELDI